MKLPSKPWWRTDKYDVSDPLPEDLKQLSPHGPALVNVYADGRTQPGWGADNFMDNYLDKKFAYRTKLFQFKQKNTPFAIVMRSVNAICIDIDGKNGGFDHVGSLGFLPPTLAEKSKSGNGYHLFYELDDEWDEQLGFDTISDAIGIVEGVDLRATGCVYHYPQQKWNGRKMIPLPEHLKKSLTVKKMSRLAQTDRIVKILEGGDEMDIAMLHAELERDLEKDIPDGKRNNTLFAIGSKLFTAGHEKWDELITARAIEVGIDTYEIEKLVSNIPKYAE